MYTVDSDTIRQCEIDTVLPRLSNSHTGVTQKGNDALDMLPLNPGHNTFIPRLIPSHEPEKSALSLFSFLSCLQPLQISTPNPVSFTVFYLFELSFGWRRSCK